LDAETGADISVDIQDIKVIKTMKKSASSLGAGLGLLVGATIGFLVGSSKGGGLKWFSMRIGGIGAAIGGIIGIGIGGLISTQITDKTIQIEGKSPEEIKEALVYLRSQARIPHYK